MKGSQPFRPVYRALWDPQLRLEEMDRHGIDLQIVCATPIMFGYEFPAAKTAAWAERMNDLALEHCAAEPSRLKALAQVPLQDLDQIGRASCRENVCQYVSHLVVAGSLEKKNKDK